LRSDDESVDDGFDEVENQLPVVGATTFVVPDAGGVVKQEHNVSDTLCTETDEVTCNEISEKEINARIAMAKKLFCKA